MAMVPFSDSIGSLAWKAESRPRPMVGRAATGRR